MCAAYKQPASPSSTSLMALALWCFFSNPAFTVVAWPPPSLAPEIYRRPPDLCIRQHPLQQPLLNALCGTKLNQMCVWRLNFTTPSHSASISMLCGAFKSGFCSSLLRHNCVLLYSPFKQIVNPEECCKCTNWYMQIKLYVETDAWVDLSPVSCFLCFHYAKLIGCWL